jgi:thiol-disulfide isomerase/thioredoxin
MPKKLIVAVALLAIAAGAGLALLQRPEAPRASFVALSGGSFSTADLRGRVVLVTFWATSCVTCVKEMPRLVETRQRFSFLLDKRGRVVAKYVGEPDWADLHARVERSLGEST